MILTVLMVVTMTLSDVLNNTATTIVAAPVGIQMAQSLGVSPDPVPDGGGGGGLRRPSSRPSGTRTTP